MAKPWWLVKGLAIFTLVLFTIDTSSDGIVGHDLYTRCHYRYAASVLSFVAVPGFLLGGVFVGGGGVLGGPLLADCISEKSGFCFVCGLLGFIPLVLLGAAIGAFLFIPATFIYLVYAAYKTSDDTQEKSKW